jgi:hypothetical protein
VRQQRTVHDHRVYSMHCADGGRCKARLAGSLSHSLIHCVCLNPSCSHMVSYHTVASCCWLLVTFSLLANDNNLLSCGVHLPSPCACRVAARKVLMQQRVAAIDEREQQRRIRMESLGKQATTAGGPDISRLMSQLENKGYTAAGDSQTGAAGSSSGTTASPGATGSGSTGQGA